MNCNQLQTKNVLSWFRQQDQMGPLCIIRVRLPSAFGFGFTYLRKSGVFSFELTDYRFSFQLNFEIIFISFPNLESDKSPCPIG